VTPRLSDAATRYVDDVAAHLGSLPAAERRAALGDLRDLLTEGVDPDDLGPAEDYAAALGARRGQEPSETLGRVLGMPVDVRGTTDPHVRSRVFDPSDPRMVVPRVLGAGWRLNYGAVAVRLGLLRPDDYDDEVLAHIPRGRRAAHPRHALDRGCEDGGLGGRGLAHRAGGPLQLGPLGAGVRLVGPPRGPARPRGHRRRIRGVGLTGSRTG